MHAVSFNNKIIHFHRDQAQKFCIRESTCTRLVSMRGEIRKSHPHQKSRSKRNENALIEFKKVDRNTLTKRLILAILSL